MADRASETTLKPDDVGYILLRIRQINLAIDRGWWARAAKIADELDSRFPCGEAHLSLGRRP